MSAPSTIAAALASLLDTAPSWLPQVDHWEIAEDTDTWILSGQLAGDPREAEAFGLLAPVIERAPSAHSDDGRLVKVPFEWDGVPGQVWYLRPVERYVVPERCATCPTLLADAGNQFVRLGGRGAPVICVPCRDRMHEAWVREAAVRELGALPMPAGPEPQAGPRSFNLVGEVTADDYDDAVYAAEQAYSGMRGQGYKGSISVDTGAGVSEAELDSAMQELSAFLRVRLALESARRGRRELRAELYTAQAHGRTFLDQRNAHATELLALRPKVAELEAERNKLVRWHAEDDAAMTRQRNLVAELRARITELEAAQQPAEGSSYPSVLPWARLMDAEDLAEFLAEVEHAIATPGATPAEALAAVEKRCGTWRVIAEAQHAHNTAPGPDAEAGEPS
ncbi:hypothetical protein GCM10010330_56590 [Streptomyces tendae]|uniref:hypothetical protein n=1 Tax=Streptomyces tendae TaxID=1932 RepID=UPI001675D125|nr:hypothetical protein [Streptomyces tendae]GHA95120.1 hypothetical protein GCM10010330_56590 [Streptomyces tendae]